MRRLAWGLLLIVAAAALGYSLVSLSRWEWTRALYFGLVFLTAEIAIATALILRRLGRSASPVVSQDPQVIARIRATRPAGPVRFDWLDPTSGRMSVFITFLVGSGLVLSGIAWIADRVARVTVTPATETDLARRLVNIAYPPEGLVADNITVLAVDVPGYDDPQLRRLLRRSRL